MKLVAGQGWLVSKHVQTPFEAGAELGTLTQTSKADEPDEFHANSRREGASFPGELIGDEVTAIERGNSSSNGHTHNAGSRTESSFERNAIAKWNVMLRRAIVLCNLFLFPFFPSLFSPRNSFTAECNVSPRGKKERDAVSRWTSSLLREKLLHSVWLFWFLKVRVSLVKWGWL